jgi:hypothetical protein
MARTVFSLVGKITMEGLGGVAKGLNDAEKGVKKFEKELGKLGRNISKTGKEFTKHISGPLTIVGGLISGLSYKVGQSADKLLDLRAATGLTTDTLQELKHVSTDAGVSFENLVGSAQNLTKRLAQVDQESGRAFEALQELGIEAKDVHGNIKPMNTLFPEVIKKLQGMTDTTRRNMLAQQLFKTELKDIAPVLDMTSDRFEELRKNAHAAGLVMSEEALKDANDFRIEVDKLKESFGALVRDIGMKFIPIMKDTVVPLVKENIVPMFQRLADEVKKVTDWFRGLPPETQAATIKLFALAVTIGPAVMLFGKLTLAIKGVTGALLLMKGAFASTAVFLATNPLGIALVAITAIAVALGTVNKQLNDIEKRRTHLGPAENEAENKNLIKWWSELRKEIDKSYQTVRRTHGAAVALQWIEEEHGQRVRNLVARAKALGHEVEGLNGTFMEQVLALDKVTTGTNILEQDQAKLAAQTKKVRELTEEELKALQAIREAREKINNEYRTKTEQLTMDRLELLDLERSRQTEAAKAVGADVEQIEQYYGLRREQLLHERNQRIADEADKRRIHQEELEQQWSDAVFLQSANRLQIIDHEHAQALEVAKKYNIDRYNIDQYYSNLRIKTVQEETVKTKNILITVYQNVTSTLGDLFGRLGSIISQFHSNRVAEVDNWLARQLKANEQSMLSEEEKEARKQELQEEAEQRRKEVQRTQAKAAKVFSVFQSIIDTARAVVSGLAQGGPKLAALYGFLGAAQTGLIMSQPIPEFATGALIEGGRGGIYGRIGEGKEDELIMPLDTGVEKLVEKINSTNGGSFGNRETHVHFHVGNYWGDEKSQKDLVRKIRPILIQEDQRTGRV